MPEFRTTKFRLSPHTGIFSPLHTIMPTWNFLLMGINIKLVCNCSTQGDLGKKIVPQGSTISPKIDGRKGKSVQRWKGEAPPLPQQPRKNWTLITVILGHMHQILTGIIQFGDCKVLFTEDILAMNFQRFHLFLEHCGGMGQGEMNSMLQTSNFP